MKVAFLGLGVMGAPLAGWLSNAGHEVSVYNRTFSKAEAWCRRNTGRCFQTISEAVSMADVVFTCVGDDPDLEAVLCGPSGALANMRPGALCVDHTTASAGLARRLSAMASESGMAFVDAPVSGGQAGAENGCLTIMVGGDRDAFDRALPLMNCYAKKVQYMGPSGQGQLTKMVNQICVAGLIQGLAEGMHFARQAGLDVAAVMEVLAKGAAQSWQMENRHQTMMEGDYDHGFAVDWMRKDLRIVLGEARDLGASLPVTALVDQFYADVQNMGGGRWDTSSLLERLDVLSASR
jgi:3-hydroxyisobutyrate dehydrogenase-like beta-hydroxyacid dehydrogenase